MRQHPTAVPSVAQICDARVEGAEIGLMALKFTPEES